MCIFSTEEKKIWEKETTRSEIFSPLQDVGRYTGKRAPLSNLDDTKNAAKGSIVLDAKAVPVPLSNLVNSWQECLGTKWTSYWPSHSKGN